MNTPYRQRVCGICASSSELRGCETCGLETCDRCQSDGACDRCLDRAVTLVLRRLATRGPGPTTPQSSPPWWATSLRLAAFGLAGAIAFSFSLRATPRPPSGRASAPPVLLAGTASLCSPGENPVSLLHDAAPGVAVTSPVALWERGKSLAASGAALTLVSVNLRRDVLDARGWANLDAPDDVQAVPWASCDGMTRALRITRVRSTSLLALLGLRIGDVITTVNGATAEDVAYQVLHEPGFSVVELSRGDRCILIGIHSSSSSTRD